MAGGAPGEGRRVVREPTPAQLDSFFRPGCSASRRMDCFDALSAKPIVSWVVILTSVLGCYFRITTRESPPSSCTATCSVEV